MGTEPSQTTTFLFTDIEGSTRHWEAHPAHMNVALGRHDEILRTAIERYGGSVFKTVGDAFCATFPSTFEALTAAIDAQRRLAVADWPEETGQIQVRMAMHAGPVEERGGDYFGPPVNRVARLLAAGHGGQVLLSGIAHDLLKGNLPEATSTLDLGEHRLKDLTKPEHIYQLVAPDLPSKFPPLETLEGAPHNLPLQPTVFIGREKEIASVVRLVSLPEVRLVTLSGPGGIGKTRLSLQAAAELLGKFGDGVFFVNLAPTADPQLVPNAVAEALGVRQASKQSMLESLKEYISERKMLLVLDNFEHVIEAAPVVWELLQAAPESKVIVTSREALRLSAEHEYPVRALSLPDLASGGTGLPSGKSSLQGSSSRSSADGARRVTAEEILRSEAVALFVARATAANSSFGLNNQNSNTIAEICVRLEGIPLAIELAAARAKLLTPQALLLRLGNRLKLLTGGARDLPARQQTLSSTIAWSHGLLNSEEKRLFRRMSVFSGGFTLEALEAVCAEVSGYRLDARAEQGQTGEEARVPFRDAGSEGTLDVLDGTESLVDKSLIYRTEEAEGDPRFRMLETISEYARERLQESGEAGEISSQHALFFLHLAEQADSELTGPLQAEWLQRLETEHDNLRSALRWLQEGEEAELLGKLAGVLTRFWLRRGHNEEGRRWFRAALENKQQLSAPVRARVLHGAGVMSFQQGDFDEAGAAFAEALELRRELGDKTGIIATTNNLANVALYHGDYEKASDYYEEALALARDLDDSWSIAVTLANQGWIEMNRGDYERAASYYEESVELRKESGDKWSIANALDNLAWARTYQGQFEEAAGIAAESMELFRELGDKDGISDILDIQGRVALGQGDYDRARARFAESVAVNQEMGDKSGIALCLMGFAALASEEGLLDQAAVLFGAADAMRAFTSGYQRVYFEPSMARTAKRMGETEWQKGVATGGGMDIDRAVAYALQGHQPEESRKEP